MPPEHCLCAKSSLAVGVSTVRCRMHFHSSIVCRCRVYVLLFCMQLLMRSYAVVLVAAVVCKFKPIGCGRHGT
eukprot:4099931-Amphidinium_carterae.1